MSSTWIEMRVAAVEVDEGGASAAVLHGDSGERLSVRVGVAEAPSIASALEGVRLERPCTYQLMSSVIAQLDGAVEHIEVTGARGALHAVIHLRCGDGARAVEARPSDAIALALRTGAPIRVARGLLTADVIALHARGGTSATCKN